MPDAPALGTRTSGSIQLRLAALLLGQYLLWGIWFVSLGSWLGATLHFDGGQIGMIYGTFAIAGMLSPMLGGAAADRLAHTERILALLHGIGGVLLLVASTQRSFSGLYNSNSSVSPFFSLKFLLPPLPVWSMIKSAVENVASGLSFKTQQPAS